ncbi:ABC transporter substrate-binding protein, partial [Kitasatospora cineracea]
PPVPALAGELWYQGEQATRPAADPTCLLKAVKAAAASGGKLRAAYVPDAATGTRWFADQDWWVRDGDAFKPFTTEDGAKTYLAAHPTATGLTYQQALDAS